MLYFSNYTFICVFMYKMKYNMGHNYVHVSYEYIEEHYINLKWHNNKNG